MKPINYILLAIAIIGAIFLWQFKKSPARNPLESETIIVGTNSEYPPFSFIKDDIITGFDIDVAREAITRMGKKMAIKDMSFNNLIPDLQFGCIDVIAGGITPTAERAKRVSFTIPYLEEDPQAIVTLASKPITTLEELRGKNVVVNEGYTADTFMTKWGGAHLTRLMSPSDAFLALNSGREEAFVTARSSVKPFFDKYEKSEFIMTPIPNTGDSVALGVSLKQTAFLEKLNSIILNMQDDGTISKLKQKWGL